MLVERKADLEKRTHTGNTPFLLACGTGVTDVVKVLVEMGADVNAVNDRKLGCYQVAHQSSGSTRELLESLGIEQPKILVPSARQYHDVSESRETRHLQRAAFTDRKQR